MMEMEIEDSDIKKNLNIMGKNTSELLNLVNQLLDFRKVDANRFVLNLSSKNINVFLSETFNKFKELAVHQKKNIQLKVPESDVFASIDYEAFTKILNNLFTNALKYSDKHIEVELLSDDTYCTIKFTNDGDLIPSELSEKIFDAFYQVNKDQQTNSSSGIGLSLVRSLTELHHGSLQFKEEGGMNEFILKLPLGKSKIEEPDDVENFIIDDSEPKNKKQSTDTILIVEDKYLIKIDDMF